MHIKRYLKNHDKYIFSNANELTLNSREMSFNGKVVLVTGASSGIGAAIAILFSKEGANLSIVGRNVTKLGNVTKKIEGFGKKPLVIKADVSTDAERIINETVARFGRIDVLVNNAGFSQNGSILDGKILQAYDDVMKTNVRAVIELTTLAAPHLAKTKGNIVNISSIAAISTNIISNMNIYFMSKAALDHFSKGAAMELSSCGIRVNCVNPGPVKTDFIENSGAIGNVISFEDLSESLPLKRVSEPEEVADLVLFLASSKAVGITGSCFVCDNGYLINSRM